MSCLPLCEDVAMNVGYAYGSGSSAEQTCQVSRDELPSDSTEDGLAMYCKAVILYCNIQERAKQNPSFLQRVLRYKIHAKQRKRIRITISLSGNANAELQAQNIFPLYALFARSISDVLVEGHSPLYRFHKACLLTSFNESGSSNHTEATFIIPDLTTLATTQACSFDIILVSCGHIRQTFDEINCSDDDVENFSLQKLEGKCFWGKIPASFLCSSLDDCADLILGRTHKFASTIVMSPGFIQPNILEQDRRMVFCSQKFNDMCPYQLRVSIYAEEAGAKYTFNSPYSFYSYSNVPPSSLDFARLRVGNVIFHYMYDNNVCQREVTEDFTCPFCLMKCGNFKGLECHLLSSHDLFNFEFKVSEKHQAVNIHLKHHTRVDELFPKAVDPRHGTFSYFSKYKKRGRLVAGTEMIVSSKTTEMIVPSKETEMIVSSKATEMIVPSKATEMIVPSKATEMIVPSKATEMIIVPPEITEVGKQGQLVPMGSKSLEYAQADFEDGHGQKENGISVSVAPDYSLPGSSLSPPKVLQFGKTRKLCVDQVDPRNRELLQKRQIFHSHKGQKMSFEEVLSDNDSEGEIDDDVVDLEERAVLDTYSDIAKDEKRIMQMWNSFVRRQRVIADGHIPWACKAFSELHGQLFVQSPSLRWCWRLFMIKLWNHNLLDARTMDACNRMIDALKQKGGRGK